MFSPDPQPGQVLARGVCRYLVEAGLAPVTEFAPAPGLRVDVAALARDGEVWVVECKSSVADFRADAKWRGYLAWCDRYFFAAAEGVPEEIFPEAEGLMRADGYGAEILRPALRRPLAPARRRALTLRLGRAAALRLRAGLDPSAAALARAAAEG